ncbi:MAG: hypothetical protein RIQ89_819 [Bacteroidota bacterium]|jgi:hypothetical protein
MKKIFYFLTFTFIVVSASAQNDAAVDTSWKKGGFIGLTFNQVGLNKAWTRGGDNAITLSGLLDVYANYETAKQKWTNNLVINYAQSKIADADFIKSDDRLDFTSKYSRKWKKHFNWVGSFFLQSQLTKTLDFKNPTIDSTGTRFNTISNFFSPAYATLGFGLEYDNSGLTVAIHPISGRALIVIDEKLRPRFFAADADLGSAVNFDLGAWLLATYKKPINDNVTFNTALSMFLPYDEPTHIDTNWDLGLIMKISKYLTANANATVRYFHNEIQDLQFRQGFGVGFGYKF